MVSYAKMKDSKHCNMKTCGKRLTFMEQNTCTCSKCKQIYCTLHRLAESHTCPHDFKNDINKTEFIEANKCVGEKLIKI
jgi:predicted nucleic acid binding AN1-type Zn finger protein